MDRPRALHSQVLHVGDRFTSSGNDSAVRDCCPILWVANPSETSFFVSLLLRDIHAAASSGPQTPASNGHS